MGRYIIVYIGRNIDAQKIQNERLGGHVISKIVISFSCSQHVILMEVSELKVGSVFV